MANSNPANFNQTVKKNLEMICKEIVSITKRINNRKNAKEQGETKLYGLCFYFNKDGRIIKFNYNPKNNKNSEDKKFSNYGVGEYGIGTFKILMDEGMTQKIFWRFPKIQTYYLEYDSECNIENIRKSVDIYNKIMQEQIGKKNYE